VFDKLRETRRQLSNSAAFAAPPASGGNLLEQILGGTPGRPPEPTPMPGGGDWNAFLQKIVAPYTVANADPRQAELVAAVDAAISALMRAILHHPDVQALEGAWRSLFFLVRRLDTDSQLKLYLLDISRTELAADLTATDDLHTTGIYRLLVDETVGKPGG